VVSARHAGGPGAAMRILHRLLLGQRSLPAFCLVLSLMIVPAGILVAIAIALLCSLAVQLSVLHFARRQA
jgi:hypothetical protein